MPKPVVTRPNVASPFVEIQIPPNQPAKIAPMKYEDNKPYGALINTTKAGHYPIKQEVMVNGKPISFTWPSSEHAYHAQKLIHLMNKDANSTDPNAKARQMIILDTLHKIANTKTGPRDEFLPHEDWDGPKGIVTDLTTRYPRLFGPDKPAFDALCDSNYHSIGNPHAGIDPKTGEPHTLGFMREVVRLKLEQHPDLKELAMNCAREGILPVEVASRDNNWASGPDGKGANMLGTLILELGNEYLQKEEPGTPLKIPDPKNYYKDLQRQAQTQLQYSSLESYTQSMRGWRQNAVPAAQQTLTHGVTPAAIRSSAPSSPPRQSAVEYVQEKLNDKKVGCVNVKVDTALSDSAKKVVKLKFKDAAMAADFGRQYGGPGVIQKGDTVILGPSRAPEVFKKFGITNYGFNNPRPIMQALIEQASSSPNLSSSPKLPKETATEYLQKRLAQQGIVANAKVVADQNNAHQKVVQLVFGTKAQADAFKAKYSDLPNYGPTPTSADGRTITLGERRAPKVFEQLHIGMYGKHNPRPLMDVLKEQATTPQVTTPRPTVTNPPPQATVQQGAVERVQQALRCQEVRIDSSQKKISIVFANIKAATDFNTANGSAISQSGRILTLDAAMAKQIFEKYGIPKHNNSSMVDVLIASNRANPAPTPVSPQPADDVSFYAFGNKRLKVQDSHIVGYQYRDSAQGPWKDSSDPSRFKRLTESFRESLQMSTYYKHATPTMEDNRSHSFEAVSDKFHNLKGDCLKTRILLTLKSQLTDLANNCDSKEQFDQHVLKIRNENPDYKILTKSQDLMTKTFGLGTSSLSAFNQMVTDLRGGIKDAPVLDERGPKFEF